MIIRYAPLRPGVEAPTRRDGDAGWDLRWHPSGGASARVLVGGAPVSLETGLAAEIPPGYYLQIQGRSGLATRGVMILGGVIDSTYRGEIVVLAAVLCDCCWTVRAGDRIAQAVLLPVPSFEWVLADELTETERGAGGFGGSGR